jgi:hypothetical protein
MTFRETVDLTVIVYKSVNFIAFSVVGQFEFPIELQSFWKRVFPAWNRRGGRASGKCREASIERRGRGGQLWRMLQKCIAKRFVTTDHPVCAAFSHLR